MNRHRPWAAAFGACLIATWAHAADLTVTVVDREGRPAEFAVVMLEPASPEGVGTWQPAPAVMSQQGVMFHPFVLPVRTGTTVSFPNLDDIRHHVYSFSSARRFELRLYGKDETKTETFEKPGIVALGCNIHDNMLSYLYVTGHPVYAVTDGQGRATFQGLRSGAFRSFVWHPDLAEGNEERAGPAVQLDPAVAGTLSLTVSLRAARRTQHPLREGAYH